MSAAGDFLAGELTGLRGVLQVVLPGHHDVARVGVVAEEAVLISRFFHLATSNQFWQILQIAIFYGPNLSKCRHTCAAAMATITAKMMSVVCLILEKNINSSLMLLLDRSVWE